eukprot:Pgem_evm2s2188
MKTYFLTNQILLCSTLLFTSQVNSFHLNTRRDTCNINQATKTDCGYTGITEEGCTAKNCCWQANNDGPWCWYNNNNNNNTDAAAWMKRTIYQVLTDRFAQANDPTSKCGDLSTYCGGTYQGLIQK